MTNQEQAKLAAEAMYNAGQARTNQQCGQVGMTSAPPGFRARIADRRRTSQAEARMADSLAELEYLLDKNPDVARILEIIDSWNPVEKGKML